MACYKRLAAVVLVAWVAEGDAQAQTPLRARVERVIDARFPGYRLLGPEAYEQQYRGFFRDGRAGTLIEGRFDFDSFRDFAVLVVSKDHPVAQGVEFNGKMIVCSGGRSGAYRCTEEPLSVSSLLDSYLLKVPSGTHYCRETDGDRKIKTSIDSIGWVNGEKSAKFDALMRDGHKDECFISD